MSPDRQRTERGQKEDVCPRCQGVGAVTVKLPHNCRYFDRCKLCGGSGHYLDALARMLGNDLEAQELTDEELLRLKSKAKSWG